jgi:hypothetical protein
VAVVPLKIRGGDRAAEDHIDAIAEPAFLLDHGDILGDRQAFPSKCGFRSAARSIGSAAHPRGNRVAFLDHDDVARDELVRSET